MAPKAPSTRVTFVRPSGDTNVRKRKKNAEEQTCGKRARGKRARGNSPEDEVMRMMKGKNPCPLQAEVTQHIESCINTAVLSVLSRKKVPAFQPVQDQLSRLKQRLLQRCKNLRLPTTKLGKLKNLLRDVQEEQRRMEEYEETLQTLNHEIEEAVDTANQIEESVQALEEKMESLKEQAPETSKSLIFSKKDPLQLPQSTFMAPTMQDEVRKLLNPELLLKELSQVQASPVYKNLQSLLPMCYAEISSNL